MTTVEGSNDSAGYVAAAMTYVRKYDPALAERIESTYNTLTVVSSGADLLPLITADDGSVDLVLNLSGALGEAEGLTLKLNPKSPKPLSPAEQKFEGDVWLNRPLINDTSRQSNVPEALYASYVLAHEWNHVAGGMEPSAYRAGTAYARQTGNPDLLDVALAVQAQFGGTA